MKDEEKTKEQLIAELAEVRRQLAELKAAQAALPGQTRDDSGRQAEELRRDQYLLQALLDHTPDHIYMKDIHCRFIKISRSGVRWLGLSDPAQVEGKTDFDFFTAEHAQQAYAEEQEMMRSGRPLVGIEERETWPDGRETWVSTTKAPLYDGEGRIVGTFGISRDITRRKQAEAALLKAKQELERRVAERTAELREANERLFNELGERKRAEAALAAEKERLAVTLRSIGDGVIATDTDGKIVLLNRVAERLTGWPQAEAVGKRLDEVFCVRDEKTRDRCENIAETVIRTGGVTGLTGNPLLIARDGAERIIADSGAPIRDKDSRIIGVVLAFRDVTEQRKMEAELLKAGKLESLGVLAGGIAHDFNNILTTILGNISLVKASAAPGDETYERLSDAERASLRARDLTRQLLTFSRGGAPIRSAASVADLLEEAASFAITGSNVRCEFDLAEDLWPVDVDAGQISQVIHNLTLNAQQAMPEGGVIRIKAENVAIGTGGENMSLPLPPGRYVKITVRDTGIGIPEEHLDKIFDPYFTTKQTGSGLGLAT
ncbi:MAG TPA: PAS domain S-box protein, partial [Blastocatellia bacterium]|nr:PAS domain S-box protein [Blastocatellia bacterium]